MSWQVRLQQCSCDHGKSHQSVMPLQAYFDAACQFTGEVNILVNNAGITRDNLAMRMKDEEWDDVLNVNMTATMTLCRFSFAHNDESALGAYYQYFLDCWRNG